MVVAAYATGQQSGVGRTPGSTPFSQPTPAGMLNIRGPTASLPPGSAGANPAHAAAGGGGLLGASLRLDPEVRDSAEVPLQRAMTHCAVVCHYIEQQVQHFGHQQPLVCVCCMLCRWPLLEVA